MKVTLLKQVGDNPKGLELEINDKTVIEAWEKLGVIAKSKSTKEEK
ncbi:hypothetical protein BN1195_03609 [Chryseobacterium oranimense G311]|nr:hypothetical protein [Chryseobacterium oranimense]CEJ71264.1 hypothetical protein BN1195_03609 [Chryseobacterium oranimense G311]DAG72869.1 MAG TPA: hypothetical protein [Caudoviricetes sp.]